jgi:UDP-N-acetylmuramoyl-tripeptide--D-alanyl-D-alanine ligase
MVATTMSDLMVLLSMTVAHGLFFWRRSLRFLRYLQQEDYDSARFGRFVLERRAFDRRGTAVSLCAALLSFWWWPAALLGAGALVGVALLEENPRRQGKIRLQMTQRARRLWIVAWSVDLLCWGLIVLLVSQPGWLWVMQALFSQLVALFVGVTPLLMHLDERRRQVQLVAQARERLEEVKPLIIGITGSYGKTSTKSLIGAMVERALGATLWTEKGVNTLMGLTREVRERLLPGHRYLIAEMAAYQRGSIARLCQLLPPYAGCITTIGSMHLNRFGSHETIKRAKSELAQGVDPEGLLVCNGDDVGAREIAKEHPKRRTLLYGTDHEQLDCRIRCTGLSAQGSQFELSWQGRTYRGSTPLVGDLALRNAAGAFCLAAELGADPDYLIALLATQQPVDQRLRPVVRGGITYLMDGYNSNPSGFGAGLDVLAKITANKRYLMTPGMIELGTIQEQENRRLAEKAAGCCDGIIFVGETNRAAWSLPGSDKLIFCTDREAAFKTLEERLKPGDAVLIENDLPDLYEPVRAL